MKFLKIPAGVDAEAQAVEMCDFKGLQEHVGGYIQVVNLGVCVIVCDDEGLLKENQHLNTFATYYYARLGGQTPIMGDVVIVDEALSPDFDGLDDRAVLELTEMQKRLRTLVLAELARNE